MSAVVISSGHDLCRSSFALLLIFLLSQGDIDNYKFDHIGYHQVGAVTCVQSWAFLSRIPNLCRSSCLALDRHLGSPRAFQRLACIRFLGRRLLYCCNGTSSFNPSVIKIVLGGDIHPQPGRSLTALRSSSTSSTVASELNVFPKNAHLNIKIAHRRTGTIF